MKTKITTKLKKLFSVWFIVCVSFLLIGIIIRIIAQNNTGFADFWQSKVAAYPRAALAYITNWMPFSLAEFLIISSPLIIVLLSRLSSGGKTETWISTFRYSLNIVGVAALVFAVLLINFGAGYYTTPLDRRLGYDASNITAEDLYRTTDALLDNIIKDIDSIETSVHGSTFMPYSRGEMNKKLNEAYKKAVEKYDFLSDFYSEPKPVVLSVPWTYTHIAGVYTFFTGEANINTNFPDYTLPYTTAHEMAHQRGMAREEEANFIAFLVCCESDDPYIRYSGYVSVFEYVAGALNNTDPEKYAELYYNKAPDTLKKEMKALNEFFKKYKNNAASTVAETINDTYLHAQGQEAGSGSYGLVVDLAVAYYRGRNN